MRGLPRLIRHRPDANSTPSAIVYSTSARERPNVGSVQFPRAEKVPRGKIAATGCVLLRASVYYRD